MQATIGHIIDGSVLEGGGQIVRNTVALAALTRQSVTIHNIRANRKPPGLKNQHAAGLKLVADISSGRLEGAENGSSSITFNPTRIRPGHYEADPGTAGSTTLLLQVALPTLLFSSSPSAAPSVLTLRGGTNATQAPQVDYAQHVLLPFLRRHFGLRAHLEVRRRGYFPRGGGEVAVTVPPLRGPLPALALTARGTITRVHGRAYAAGALPLHVARKTADGARAVLLAAGVPPERIVLPYVRESEDDAVGSGSGIVMWAETEEGCVLGGSAVGTKGKDARKLGAEAAQELVRNIEHGAASMSIFRIKSSYSSL